MLSHSLPIEFVERMAILFPETSAAVLQTFTLHRPTTFRANSIKVQSGEVEKRLKAQGFDIEKSALPGAFVLKNRTQRELTETPEYKEGLIYIQGLSSMIPPLVLEPKEGESVLDICSAPGSKTTQIAALMNNSGQIIANDMSRVRLYKLSANIKTLGVTNVVTMHMRAQDLWRKFPQTFDCVLADVPCSLEGRFVEDNPKSYANWSVKKIKILSEHQKHILRSASSCTKSGGTIVYSTCTIAPEENEEVVDWILKKDPSLSLEKVTVPSVETLKGITQWSGKEYVKDVEKCIRILPSATMEAFFLAKFRKK